MFLFSSSSYFEKKTTLFFTLLPTSKNYSFLISINTQNEKLIDLPIKQHGNEFVIFINKMNSFDWRRHRDFHLSFELKNFPSKNNICFIGAVHKILPPFITVSLLGSQSCSDELLFRSECEPLQV